VVAAVLGPTYLGNVFQASNNLPNLVYMGLIGALISSLLVPPLVRLIDQGDRRGAERLAGAFLGTALLVFGVAALLVILAGPLILELFTLGVSDVEQAAGQRAVGRLLLLLCMPQLLLYGVVGTCEAVMNAHGRFALASAAPISENLGVILTMGATAVIFGVGQDAAVPTEQLILMGVGCTMAVAVHAAIDWWGVRRLGVRLVPRPGWRDPVVREVIHRAVPSLGYSGLDVAQLFAIVVMANGIPGGVVAFDLAMNFYVLPSALCARPVGIALLPQLSRLTIDHKMGQFKDELIRGASLMFFFAVPAAVGLAVLAGPIAEGVSFGAMAGGEGRAMLEYALLGLSAGVIGECALLLCTYASYARSDVRSPVLAMVIRLGVAACGIGAILTLPQGPMLLLALGLLVSIADLIGAAFLALRLRSVLPTGQERLFPAILRSAAAAAVTVIPALLAVTVIPDLLRRGGPQVGVTMACIFGAFTYVLVQAVLRSPELKLLLEALRSRRAASDA
ncbi:MAG TPA: lipid II flippase MurJ, partial [Propionibacteriaceae bacterium]|nr:lipid II flippase MurJ [Propionibacteriaceae bacterium]